MTTEQAAGGVQTAREAVVIAWPNMTPRMRRQYDAAIDWLVAAVKVEALEHSATAVENLPHYTVMENEDGDGEFIALNLSEVEDAHEAEIAAAEAELTAATKRLEGAT